MNTKLLLLSVFTVCYFLGTQWFYSNKLSGACCGASTAPETEAITASTKLDLPLSFQWQDASPILGTGFSDYKSEAILNGMKEDNILQITASYFKDETPPDGYNNMGLARAAAIRALIKESIPEDRVDVSSRVLEDHENMRVDRFQGVSFNWRAALKKEETTIVEIENESTNLLSFQFFCKGCQSSGR